MPRKTIKSLEAQLNELRELNGFKERREVALMAELSDTKQRLKESQMRQAELTHDKSYFQRLCGDLSAAIRTRS